VSETSGDSTYRAGELLRRIAQLVAFAEDATPEIRVGDSEELAALDGALSAGVPPELKTMYAESDPASLSVPLAGEDLDFIPLEDVNDVIAEEALGEDFVPFARAGKTLLCVRTTTTPETSAGGVVALRRVGTEWEEEAAGTSLDSFLTVLSEILERLRPAADDETGAASAGQGLTALVVELSPETLVEIESAVGEIDPDHTDFWMSLLS
jgi:hypothetical protein